MVNAQQWLDQKYPKQKRHEIKELYISSYKKIFERYGDTITIIEKKTVLNDNEQLIGKLKLEGFINLKKLDCWGNQLTELDISDCHRLEELYCSSNDLTDLELNNCQKSLEVLSCFNNQITSLNLSNFQNLEKLDLNEFDRYELLNFSNNNSILTDLSLSNCRNLKALNCGRNKLVYLNLYGCQNLEKLNCRSNQLTNISFLTNLPNKEKLIYLDIGNNKFNPQDLFFLEMFGNLKELYLGNNRFHGSLEPLKGMNKLQELSIGATDINSGLEYLPNSMSKIYCKDVQESSQVTKLKTLLEPYEVQDEYGVYYYDFQAWKNKVSLSLQEWLGSNYPYKEVKKISIAWNSWKETYGGELYLEDYPELEEVLIDGQHLKSKLIKLCVINCPNLTKLNCGNNQLTYLDLKNCPKLIKLYCPNNRIENLKIDNCLQLTSICLSNNLIKSLDFLNSLDPASLVKFKLNDNNFAEQDLSYFRKFTNLKSLWISNVRESGIIENGSVTITKDGRIETMFKSSRNVGENQIDRDAYNKFIGSLEPLRNLAKLEVLSIYNTDIESGLEYLPNNIKAFYCSASKKEPMNKVRIIEQMLRRNGDPAESYNFTNLLEKWNEINKEKATFSLTDSSRIEERQLVYKIDQTEIYVDNFLPVLPLPASQSMVTYCASAGPGNKITTSKATGVVVNAYGREIYSTPLVLQKKNDDLPKEAKISSLQSQEQDYYAQIKEKMIIAKRKLHIAKLDKEHKLYEEEEEKKNLENQINRLNKEISNYEEELRKIQEQTCQVEEKVSAWTIGTTTNLGKK